MNNPQSGHRFSILEADQTFVVPADEEHRFVLVRLPGYVLEVPDIHFHHDSVVMLPDCAVDDHEPDGQAHEEHAGLGVLAAALRYAGEHPSQLAIVMGHTDTSGGTSYNNPLSLKRSKSVLQLLQATDEAREAWRQGAQAQSKVEDYQLVLKYFAARWNWNCDPGAVDNDHGPATDRAVRAFQDVYNRRVAGKTLAGEIEDEHPAPQEPEHAPDPSDTIAVDGRVGPDTWGGVFDVYQHSVKRTLGVEASRVEELREALTWIDDAKPAVGCGESFPIDAPNRDNFRSHTNRRVEIRFVEAEHRPPLPCHPSDDEWNPDVCIICRPEYYWWTIIPVTPELLHRKWRIRLLMPGSGKLAERPPLADKAYTITRNGAAVVEGTSTSSGVIEYPVFDEDEDVTLEIDGLTIFLEGGDLAPIGSAGDTPIKQRLWNLGFGRGAPDEWDDSTFRSARRSFKRQEMDLDDDLFDDSTVQVLRVRHGS